MPSRPKTALRLCASIGLTLMAAILAGCGSTSHPATSTRVAPSGPPGGGFPSARGKTVAELTRGLGSGPIVAPTVKQLSPGPARFGFALFTVAQKQVTDVPVALYLERQGASKVTGPFPATQQSLQVGPQFQSDTVKNDPAAAKSFYSTELRFPRPGIYAIVALSRIGGRVVASSPIGARVLRHDPVPGPGDVAPKVTTPTVQSVHGDLAKIDTRQPHDDMHKVNYADVYGKKAIVLLFSTPALCQSRTCAPVTDVTAAVEAQHRGDPVVFIHNEIYKDNTIKPGCLEGTRAANQCFFPQLLAFHLETEPFLFVIDRHGRIVTRLEGSFSKNELEAALRPVLGR
jgi:hypothetical protein